jgi:hypothetical protein
MWVPVPVENWNMISGKFLSRFDADKEWTASPTNETKNYNSTLICPWAPDWD